MYVCVYIYICVACFLSFWNSWLGDFTSDSQDLRSFVVAFKMGFPQENRLEMVFTVGYINPFLGSEFDP